MCEEKSYSELFGEFCVFCAIWPAELAFKGFILSIIWGWFMVPLGIIPIGILHCIGIAMVINFIIDTNNDQHAKKMEGMTFFQKLCYILGASFLGPIFVLTGAFIVHYLMAV